MPYDVFRRELDAQLQQIFVRHPPSLDSPEAWAPGGSGVSALAKDLHFGFAGARDRAAAPASGTYDSEWERAYDSEWERLGHTSSRTLTDSQIVRFSVRQPHAVFEAFNGIGNGRAELASYVRHAELEERLARDPFPAACSKRSPRHDVGAIAEYALLRGIDPDVAHAPRFRGGWHLCTERSGSCPVTWESRAVFDGPGHLYASIKELLEAADERARDPRRALHPEFVEKLLRREVDDWAAMMNGRTTERGLTEVKLREAAEASPSLETDVRAALQGDAQSRERCLREIRYSSELSRVDGSYPRARTWSLWASRGSSADTRLVISARAIDALSYHQLHPDDRTRYLALEGDRTPARDAILQRAMSLMPERSSIVIATDNLPRPNYLSGRGRELAQAVGELARHHPTLRLELARPQQPTWNRELVMESELAIPSHRRPTRAHDDELIHASRSSTATRAPPSVQADDVRPTSEPTHELLRWRLNDVLDWRAPVGHHPGAITQLVHHLRSELHDHWSDRLLEAGDTTKILPARTPEGFTLPGDGAAPKAYAIARVFGASALASSRFEGDWSLWTSRANLPDERTLWTRAAIDSNSALRASVNQILDDANARPSPDRTDGHLCLKLFHRIDDWDATLRGETTARTMNNAQLAELGKRPGLEELSRAAIAGDLAAKRECLSLIRFDELDRHMTGRPPNSVTWSLWTSKVLPHDEKLVLTRRAIDAISFHHLTPDARTRYASFDGPETPAGNLLLSRTISQMRSGSTIVIATDRTPAGQALERRIHALRSQHPSHSFVLQLPERGRESWNEQLKVTPSRQEPAIAPKEALAMALQPPRSPGHGLGLGR